MSCCCCGETLELELYAPVHEFVGPGDVGTSHCPSFFSDNAMLNAGSRRVRLSISPGLHPPQGFWHPHLQRAGT